MRNLVVAALVLFAVVGPAAARPTLDPHDAGTFTVSLPSGWTISGDAGNVVAQADPTQPDAPELVVTISPSSTSEANAIDAITGKLAGHVHVQRRSAGPHGTGMQVLATGSVGTTTVRLAALAVHAIGSVVVCVLVAAPDALDRLGGADLIAHVVASLKAHDPSPPPTIVSHDPTVEPMLAQYDSYHALIVPPPPRPITVADLVGTWGNDNAAVSRWATTYGTEGYTRTQALSWQVDAKGNVTSIARGAPRDKTGTISLAPDGVVTLALEGDDAAYYVLRGWFFDGRHTVIMLNGPWHRTVDIRAVRDRTFATNLNAYWVRTTK